MLIDQDDVKTKWCPFSRMGNPNMGGTLNRVPDEDGNIHNQCIGSGCMAWRPAETAEFRTRAENEFRRTGRRLSSNAGYCGLAGRPE